MTRTLWIEVARWALAAAGVVIALLVTLYVSMFLVFWDPYPRRLVEPTAGFLMGALPVLAGAAGAPRLRRAVAVVLAVASLAAGIAVLGFHALGTLAGGAGAAGGVAWWIDPRRTGRSTAWVGGAAGVAAVAFAALVYALHVDALASPAPLPAELAQALGPGGPRVAAFYRYELGGFIDRERLWRIDAAPDAVGLIVDGLGLSPTATVPARFWQMPPHYWPRAMPAGGQAFRSPAFSADGRGPDGDHFLLVHDRSRERAFVWLKSNF